MHRPCTLLSFLTNSGCMNNKFNFKKMLNYSYSGDCFKNIKVYFERIFSFQNKKDTTRKISPFNSPFPGNWKTHTLMSFKITILKWTCFYESFRKSWGKIRNKLLCVLYNSKMNVWINWTEINIVDTQGSYSGSFTLNESERCKILLSKNGIYIKIKENVRLRAKPMWVTLKLCMDTVVLVSFRVRLSFRLVDF